MQKTIAFRMKNTKKKLNSQSKVVKASFTGSNITRYSRLNTVVKYMNRQNIVKSISASFPTQWKNATKFGVNQILLAITLASISGISRIRNIADFSGDGLVKALLKLDKAINENALSAALKELGQNGTRKLQGLLLLKNGEWLHKSGLKNITLDADSTVKSVCSNQEGAAKGYNTTKKGAKSYHPLLVFVSEMKLLYYTWFRTGSAYTSNGIIGFLQEVKASLPETIEKVFFCADSGFFSGELFDLLELFNWDYLVKVKLKNLEKLLQSQIWISIKGNKDVAICEFTYKANSWSKTRVLKAMRSVKEYVQVEYLGEKQIVPVYQYVCYASNYDMDAFGLHELYKQCSTSETWIEQVKGHTMAGSTLTDNFWANDILWQLNVLAYNILVMIPQKKSKFKKQEHQTFIDWFIAVPAKITSSGHQIELKMYEHHFNKVDWEALDRLIEAAHTDGACHSPDNQNFCKDNDISLYLHAIQGAKGRYQFNISENRKLSVFDTTTKEIIDSKKITCKNDIDKWRIKTEKGYRYFTHKDILSCLIRKQIEETPIETLQIRNNVEATIFQLAYHYSNAKSRYRGEIKHQMWANIRCLWVNFVRILKYIKQLCQRTLFPAKYALRLFYTELYFAFKIFLTAILPHHLSNSENAEFSFT